MLRNLCSGRRELLSSLLAGTVLRVPQSHGCTYRKGPAMAQVTPRVVGNALNFVLLGDVMLGRYVDDEFETPNRKRDAFGTVLPYISQLDPSSTIVAGNLECAVTQHPVPTPKAFNFKLSPRHADVLQELGLAYVSLANNHVLDYGQEGLVETHRVLDQLGVAHSGSGKLPEAAAPAIVSRVGYKVAFLSYSDHYDEWAADSLTPGINFIDPTSFNKDLLHKQVAAARGQGADLVLVFIHWGPNWSWQPSRHIQQLGRAFLSAGADLVFGHSAHHIQGVELIGRQAIIYGAGGFIDDYATDAVYRNELGCVWLAAFAPPSPAAGHVEHPGTDDDVGASSRDQRQAAAGAATSTSATCASGTSSALQLQSLKAVPLYIHHDWRPGVQVKEPGEGSPPYFSQVDLAHGDAYSWVVDKLEELCSVFGTKVVKLPEDGGVQFLGGKLKG